MKNIKTMAEKEYPDNVNCLIQRNAYIKGATDERTETIKILNTVCHPDHAKELIGYIMGETKI